jgi:hypothetical protein
MMPRCPNCHRRIFPGAIDCLRCGHISGERAQTPEPLLGQPLYPQYRKPGIWAPWMFGFAGFVLAAIGVGTALFSDSASCTGRGGMLCMMASALSQALFGAPNPNLAEGAVWIALALLCWSFAWHLHAMWFRPRK